MFEFLLVYFELLNAFLKGVVYGVAIYCLISAGRYYSKKEYLLGNKHVCDVCFKEVEDFVERNSIT